jgi:hypothetical protein
MKNYFFFACIFSSVSGGSYLPLLPRDYLHTENSVLPASAIDQTPSSPKNIANIPAEFPLELGHAHNDYEHKRPLLDALSLGFNYIEVDVYLIDGELFVSHLYPLFKDEQRTLKTLYLEPLNEIIRNNGGQIFRCDKAPLNLMIDVKTDAFETYEAIKSQLYPYRKWITSYNEGTRVQRAVNVFISGNRPVALMACEKRRMASLDGRINDLGKGYSPELMPVVSERFSNVFGLNLPFIATGEYQWAVFKRLTQLARSEGKIFRLWGSPEEESVWEKLLANGSGLINTNDLTGLHDFLKIKWLPALATEPEMCKNY